MIPHKAAKTFTEYARVPFDEFSRYQPTNCPIGTKKKAMSPKIGTITAVAAANIGILSADGTPHTCAPALAPT